MDSLQDQDPEDTSSWSAQPAHAPTMASEAECCKLHEYLQSQSPHHSLAPEELGVFHRN